MKKLVLALSVIAFTACNNNQQKDKTTPLPGESLRVVLQFKILKNTNIV